MLVVHAGQLIDGNGGPPRYDVTVWVEGARISRIEPATAVGVPQQRERIAQVLLGGKRVL